MLSQLLPALRLVLILAVFTGIIFPCMITAISQICLSHQANGSLVTENGKIVGSELLGQQFNRPEFFHPRPSAAGSGYAGEASGGTNLGPTSKKLIEGDTSFSGLKQLAQQYRTENKLSVSVRVPVDAVTRSGSGLDPSISLANAELQTPRVANKRGLPETKVRELVNRYTENRPFGILGEPAVNVLKLNRALQALK